MNVRRTVIRPLGLVLFAVFAAGSVLEGPMLNGVRGPSGGFLPEAPQADRMNDLTGIKNVSCEQARDIVQGHQGDPNFVILDFRTKEMFDQAHIRGAVCHDVFLPDIDDWLKALDKKKTYLIYCTLGHRSGIALAKMNDLGFVNVLHMHEGLSRWKQLGYETVSGNSPGLSETQKNSPASGLTLSENLKILEPLVDRHWVGEMKSPDGSRTFKTDQNFQVVWDGSVVRYTGSIPEIDSYSEGHFFWDREAQKVAVVIFSTRGVVRRGTVSVENGVVTVQGKVVFPDRTFDYKNTFEFMPDGKMIDRWFQNAFGPWQPGHVVEFIEQKTGK
jgi:rhodanese-related sulfurtransferase